MSDTSAQAKLLHPDFQRRAILSTNVDLTYTQRVPGVERARRRTTLRLVPPRHTMKGRVISHCLSSLRTAPQGARARESRTREANQVPTTPSTATRGSGGKKESNKTQINNKPSATNLFANHPRCCPRTGPPLRRKMRVKKRGSSKSVSRSLCGPQTHTHARRRARSAAFITAHKG